MTVTYDASDPAYLDEASVRHELSRVFDLCHGCRLCVEYCTSFPTLFEMIDRFDDPEAGRLTPAQQDEVVDECFQCKLCHVHCPYRPELHEWQVDFPRLMLRAQAMRRASGQQPIGRRTTTRILGCTDQLGRAATAMSATRRIIDAREGSATRQVVAKIAGVSSIRMLPPHARQRFSTWFERRTSRLTADRQGRVTIFATCHVEYGDTRIGSDLVGVYERNGIECANSSAGCCGAAWLHAGEIGRFAKVAERNVATLAAEVRLGGAIVVPQPTCGYVLKQDYLGHVRPSMQADAAFVAEHTYDAAEYLMKVHGADDTELDLAFGGEVPSQVIHHVACPLRAQHIERASRDLMELTGAAVELVQQCSGVAAMWGWRAENEEISIPIAKQLGEQVVRAGADRPGSVVTGDCSLANTAIAEQTGAQPCHPIQLVARAYGIPGDA